MGFNATNWKYSETKGFVAPVAGLRNLKIVNAEYDENAQNSFGAVSYNVEVRDVDSGSQYTLRYWLKKFDNGNLVPNSPAEGTLISLGTALAGSNIGIPFFNDIIGGVVVGEIVIKEYPKTIINEDGSESTQVKHYANCYKFFPASESVVLDNSDIDQYSKPDE